LHARGDVAGMPRIPRLDVGLHPITVNVIQLSQRSAAPFPGLGGLGPFPELGGEMTPKNRWSSPSGRPLASRGVTTPSATLPRQQRAW
jgi:hypothetical protein